MMSDADPAAGASAPQIAALREEIRRIVRQDERRGAIGCGLFFLVLVVGAVVIGRFSLGLVLVPFLAIFAGMGLAAVSRVASARRIATKIRHLSVKEKVETLGPWRSNLAVQEVLEPMLRAAKPGSEVAPATPDARGNEIAAARE
jgi:hypothetical protein